MGSVYFETAPLQEDPTVVLHWWVSKEWGGGQDGRVWLMVFRWVMAFDDR